MTSGDVKYITVTLQGKTVVGASMELGRGRLVLNDVLTSAHTAATGAAACEMNTCNRRDVNVWLPMIHDASKQRIGYVLVSARFQENLTDSNMDIL